MEKEEEKKKRMQYRNHFGSTTRANSPKPLRLYVYSLGVLPLWWKVWMYIYTQGRAEEGQNTCTFPL